MFCCVFLNIFDSSTKININTRIDLEFHEKELTVAHVTHTNQSFISIPIY